MKGLINTLVRNPLMFLFILILFLYTLIEFISARSIKLSQLNNEGAYQDTYYHVSHFHYAISWVLILFLFLIFYYLFEKVFKAKYNRYLSGAHWICWIISITFSLYPSLIISKPSRYTDYSGYIEQINLMKSTAKYLFFIGIMFFALAILDAIRRRYNNPQHNTGTAQSPPHHLPPHKPADAPR